MISLRRGATLCAVLVVVAVLSTVPWLEMGLNDDWSFAFIARGFARTGRIAYNGWAAPLLGLQAISGGWLVRAFGFSFTLLRLSTLPYAAGCSCLLYALGRRTGLNHSTAVFGALTLGLSPVFIPLAASFMTDVPGLFFWLACSYCAVRGAAASTPRRCTGWLAAAALTGFAGGTIRQIVWAAPSLVLPAVAWLRRRERAVPICAAVFWCAITSGAAACLRWYQAQPGHEPVPTEKWSVILAGLAEPVRMMILAALLWMLPVLLLFLAGWRKWLRAPAAPLFGTLGTAAFVAACTWWFEDDFLLGNMVTDYGVLRQGTEAMGDRPVILGAPVLVAVAVALCTAAGFTAAWLAHAFRHRSEWSPAAAPLRLLLFLTLPPSALYVAAVSFRYASDGILFDRYLIYLTPPLIVALLWIYQTRIRPTPPRAAWAVLLLLGFYGVAATHDYIAAGRARLYAASEVTASGVPRTRVSAGLEYDGWTQLEVAGSVPSLSTAENHPRAFPLPHPYWFWQVTTAVDPLYVAVYSPVPGLQPSAFPSVGFRAWLPPFRRRVLIRMLYR
jgi:hypothetical protein